MIRSLALLVCVGALTSGCGQSEETFNKSFDEGFRKSCITSATQGAAPPAIATQFCDCVLEKIDKKYAITEKVTLSDGDVQPFMEECMRNLNLPNG